MAKPLSHANPGTLPTSSNSGPDLDLVISPPRVPSETELATGILDGPAVGPFPAVYVSPTAHGLSTSPEEPPTTGLTLHSSRPPAAASTHSVGLPQAPISPVLEPSKRKGKAPPESLGKRHCLGLNARGASVLNPAPDLLTELDGLPDLGNPPGIHPLFSPAVMVPTTARSPSDLNYPCSGSLTHTVASSADLCITNNTISVGESFSFAVVAAMVQPRQQQ